MTTASTEGPNRDRRPPRPVGRPAVLSRHAIADAAVEVGFDRLTLVAVAEHLGVAHASLYGHVRNRDDLVLAAAERVAERMDPADATHGWRTLLESEAWALWRTFLAHPGMVAAVTATGQTPPAVRQRYARICDQLVADGIDATTVLLATDSVYDLVLDAAARGAEVARLDDEQRRAAADSWSGLLGEEVQAAMTAMFTGEPDDWFDRKLRLLLAGIEATLTQPTEP